MRKQLFRKEVLNSQGRRLIGDVLVTQPTSLTILSLSVFVVAVFISLFLVFGTYAKKERVSGYLVPDKGLIKIYTTNGGVVLQSHVSEGNEVKEGDVLFTVSLGRNSVDGNPITEGIVGELSSAQAELQIQIDYQRKLLTHDIEELSQKITSNESEAKRVKEQIEISIQRVDLIQRAFIRLKQLFEDGAVPEQVLQEKHAELLQIQERVAGLQRQRLKVEHDTNVARLALKKIPVENDILIAGLKRQLADLRKREIEAKGEGKVTIKAPISGIVTAVLVSVGQNTSSNSPMLTLLPLGAELQAHLFVPARAIGFIKNKQTVHLRYSAFPYQRYGVHDGSISEISRVILKPDELSVPIPLSEPVYRLKVSLHKKSIDVGNESIQLQPGLLLEGDIILDNRYLIDWLIEPFFQGSS